MRIRTVAAMCLSVALLLPASSSIAGPNQGYLVEGVFVIPNAPGGSDEVLVTVDTSTLRGVVARAHLEPPSEGGEFATPHILCAEVDPDQAAIWIAFLEPGSFNSEFPAALMLRADGQVGFGGTHGPGPCGYDEERVGLATGEFRVLPEP